MGSRAAWMVAALFACGCGGAHSGSTGNGPSAPDDGAAQLIGRSQPTSAGPEFSLAGTTLRFHFQGTGLSVHLVEQSFGNDASGAPLADEYEVLVDGQSPTVLTTPAGDRSYPVATGLPNGEHTVTLVKRTESMVGAGTLAGATVENGSLLAPPARSDRRIEFIGDSTESGYGDEGASADCPFTSATENHYGSYPSRTADLLSAEEITVSYSGKGVSRNFDGSAASTLPTLYGRAVLPDPDSRWDFGQWVPQVVVIDLGANDFFAGVPDANAFVSAYEGFVHTLRAHYPQAQLFVALSPLLTDAYPKGAQARTYAREDLQRVVNELQAAGDTRIRFIELPELALDQMGCDYHPNLATHAAMAAQLAQAIHAATGW